MKKVNKVLFPARSEIMAAEPIIRCFQKADMWFTGVAVTDGRGSPRDGHYQSYTDEEMRLVRFKEQKKAAFVGEYAAQIILDHPSKAVKDGSSTQPVDDLVLILKAARPNMYTPIISLINMIRIQLWRLG